MIHRYLLAGLCLLGGACAASWGQPAQPGPATRPSALDVLRPYIGKWQIKATWAGSDASLDARSTYEWGLNNKFIVAKTFVKLPDGREYQRYESVFAEKDGLVVCHGFTYSGEVDVRTFQREGNKLSTEWTTAGADGMGKFRQSVELIDNDHIHWLVWRERDGNWEKVMDGKWERVTASAAK
jgi:hypothetical protein